MIRTRQFAIISTVALTALLASSTAWAQRGRRDPPPSQQQDPPRTGAAQRRGAGQTARPAPAPSRVEPSPQANRPSQARQPQNNPPQGRADNRPQGSPQAGSRGRDDGRQVRPPQNVPQGRFDDRQGRAPSVASRGYVAPRDRNFVRPSFMAPRYRVQLARPYYSFRPRLQIGIGFYVGTPFAYPNWYDPYRGYGSSYYGSRLTRYGGISFDIEPYDADVYIDGRYVGQVCDYSPYEGPLTLDTGRHWIELRAPGYGPMSFEITVVPGQVIPYRGTLPYRW